MAWGSLTPKCLPRPTPVGIPELGLPREVGSLHAEGGSQRCGRLKCVLHLRREAAACPQVALMAPGRAACASP